MKRLKDSFWYDMKYWRSRKNIEISFDREGKKNKKKNYVRTREKNSRRDWFIYISKKHEHQSSDKKSLEKEGFIE